MIMAKTNANASSEKKIILKPVQTAKPKAVKVVEIRKQKLTKNHVRELYKPAGRAGSEGEVRERFEESILYPDLTGPFRVPRIGEGTKTGLGMMCSKSNYSVAQTGSSAAVFTVASTCNGMGTLVAYCYSANADTNYNTAVSNPQFVPPTIAFPSASSVGQIAVTSMSMTVEYLGNPLNAQGQVSIGSYAFPGTNANNGAWSVTYNSMRMLPGFIELPIADLIAKPIRVAGIPVSSTAQEFVQKNDAGFTEWQYPVIMFSGGVPDAQVQICTTVNFEYTTQYGNTGIIIPYQKQGPNLHVDINAFQDALNNIEGLASSVTSGFSDKIFGKVRGLLSKDSILSTVLKTAGSAALSYFSGGLLHAACEQNGHGPLAQYVGVTDSVTPSEEKRKTSDVEDERPQVMGNRVQNGYGSPVPSRFR